MTSLEIPVIKEKAEGKNVYFPFASCNILVETAANTCWFIGTTSTLLPKMWSAQMTHFQTCLLCLTCLANNGEGVLRVIPSN